MSQSFRPTEKNSVKKRGEVELRKFWIGVDPWISFFSVFLDRRSQIDTDYYSDFHFVGIASLPGFTSADRLGPQRISI